MSAATCNWCRSEVEADGGYRAYEPATGRRATFCRLEHVVPWLIRGPQWSFGRVLAPTDNGLGRCAWCASPLSTGTVLLVRHRAEHRIADAFCDAEHLLEWAKAGGRWRTAI